MSDLVERLTYPEWTASKSYKASEQGNLRLLDAKAPYEAAARITELAAEVKSLRDERAQLSRGINMAMGCLNIFRTEDEKLAWYRLHDVVSGKEPRTALSTPTPPATDPVMTAFHDPRRDLGNGAVPYAPTEEV